MAMRHSIFILLLFLCITGAAQQKFPVQISVDVSKELAAVFKPNGRALIFFSKDASVDPVLNTWPMNGNFVFGKNLAGWLPSQKQMMKNDGKWTGSTDWNMDEIPAGEYFVQFLWDQQGNESRITEPGNLYSEKKKILVNGPQSLSLTVSKITTEPKIEPNKYIEFIDFTSKSLSAFWKKEMHVKAAVLLPSGYFDHPGKAYPICYNIAGFGGRYYSVGYWHKRKDRWEAWMSKDAPQVINVFLDGEGPLGDPYQLDSENSGPFGTNLVEELIPYIEKKYRNSSDPSTRFVAGCSTGGWVSLALQIYYPDVFAGCYSYSPDAIDFENYQLTNIYKDKNLYYNEFNYLRPIMRNTDGEPMISCKEFIQYENALGSNNTYITSGGQIGSHTALYSPRGADGLPRPMFDAITGEIDHNVAEAWRKYDLKLYAKTHWATLGPKLQGKIYIWMGDMDHFYLNTGTRGFADFIKTTANPRSDAVIEFTPQEGHCQEYSFINIMQRIAKKTGG